MNFNIEKYREIKDFIKKTNNYTEIIAISKNHPKESVLKAIECGILQFGENRVMEAKTKFIDIKKQYPNLKLHLTGPLQSNKVKEAAELFDVFHTLDREKIALEFVKHREKIANKEFFIQVNTGEEKSKSGVYRNHLTDFINFCSKELNLKICGLMCIPPINEDPSEHFLLLANLAKLNNFKQLSIGMSNDYEAAIKNGATYIIIGTLLFGVRK